MENRLDIVIDVHSWQYVTEEETVPKEKEIYHSKTDVTAFEWSRLAQDICYVLQR